jgi:hypothetical protein
VPFKAKAANIYRKKVTGANFCANFAQLLAGKKWLPAILR